MIILEVMKEKKGFIELEDRKVVDGIEVAPDRVKVYFNLQSGLPVGDRCGD